MVDVAGIQKMGSWFSVRIIHGEVNLKFQDCSLIQALFDEVNAVPLRQGHGLEVLLSRLQRVLLRWLVSHNLCRHHEHANYWVLLHQFVIHFKHLISCQKLLLMSNLGDLRAHATTVTILLRCQLIYHATAISGRVRVIVATISALTVALLLLEVVHKLNQGFRYLRARFLFFH